MTVIAWDGTTLAADRQSTNCGNPKAVTKIFRVADGLVGFAGGASHAMALLDWIKAGYDPAKWPAPYDKDDGAVALFVGPHGIWLYSSNCGGYPERIEERFTAMGAGRDYALAAMFLGKTAMEAVGVACALDVFCGMGVDTLRRDW